MQSTINDCSGTCWPMSDQVGWAGVCVSGTLDCSEEMEGEWRFEFRVEAGDYRLFAEREEENMILLKS